MMRLAKDWREKTTRLELADHAATFDLGRELAAHLVDGDVVLLHGDLGAGKTTLVQGVAAGLGITEAIQSPTFGLVAEHTSSLPGGDCLRVLHLDLYRLEDPEELEGIGYEQFIEPEGAISLIEWPERAGDWLPPRFLLVRIAHGIEGGRTVDLSWHDERG